MAKERVRLKEIAMFVTGSSTEVHMQALKLKAPFFIEQ
jgi:hypothetical protein